MKTYTNPLTQKIADILSPLVGKSMSVGFIMSQTKKLNIDEEAINLTHLPALAEGIAKGLVIFLGSEAAQQVSSRIKNLR